MRYKIEELKDITDSREIMQSTPNGFSKYMMYIIIALLTLVIAWSTIAKKEITVRASGVVKPSEETYKIASGATGSVTTVNLKEGLEVKKGDTLVVVNGEEYELQQSVLQEALDKKEKELKAVKSLKSSVADGTNYLSQDDEVESNYYKKYELYTQNLSNYSKQGASAETQLSNIRAKIDDLNLLLKSIQEEKNYFSKDHYMYYQYVDYEMTLNQYKDQISSYENQIKELESKRVDTSSVVVETQSETTEEDITDEDTTQNVNLAEENNKAIDAEIKTLNNSIDSVKSEIEKYKNSQKSTITSNIAQNEQSLKEGSVSTNSSTYKEQYLTELDSSISALEDSIQEIKMNLELATTKVEATTIKAEYDGVINIINEIKVGDYIQNGTQIASIVPNKNTNYMAEVYIENQNFGEISEGENVILEFVALPQSEYGTIKSTLQNISVDAKVSEEQGTSYYTGACAINETSMKNKKGNAVDIKNGMLVQARIINREISYFRYFLEKINILD